MGPLVFYAAITYINSLHFGCCSYVHVITIAQENKSSLLIFVVFTAKNNSLSTNLGINHFFLTIEIKIDKCLPSLDY